MMSVVTVSCGSALNSSHVQRATVRPGRERCEYDFGSHETSLCVSTLPMRQRELGVRHIEFVSPRRREGVRRVEANVDLTRCAQNGTNVE
jgi:hypothetical protein